MLPIHVYSYVAEKLCHMEFDEATVIKHFIDQMVIMIHQASGMQVAASILWVVRDYWALFTLVFANLFVPPE